MDSGNSGSMQSSSGGDDEFESPSDSISASAAFTSFPQNFHSQSSASAAAIFDPLSNLFDPRSSHLSNQNPLLNLDMLWSRTVRSDQIPSDLHPPPPNSGTTDHNLSPISNNYSAVQNYNNHPSDATNSFAPSDHTDLQNIPNNCASAGASGGGGAVNTGRNSKKRPRASRRAPTTVLTTDTTNFRAMVQEFTGIPAPPFTASSSSSPFTRNAGARFDLFGGGGGGGGNRTSSSTHLDVVPNSTQQTYLLRPFPQKAPFLSPSPSTFLAGSNLQNPIFDIQNMFQSNPNKLISSSNEQNLKMGIFEEFGLTTHGGHGLSPAGQGLPRSNGNHNINNNNNNGHHHTPANWVMGGGVGESNQQGINLRSSNGNLNGKLIRYTAGGGNSSGFLGDKAVENLRARNEGMVEPWICSSD
ncbi:CAR1 transcription factor-like [Cucumis melo var. makuwa]|nr:CAR1 transcription factor-like [Cucumis melo var. makuwa]